MATLYLHIGTPKTGTTAIQRFCVENRKALKRCGYCFPRPLFFYPNISSERNGNFLIRGRRGPEGNLAGPAEERNWRKGMKYLAALFRRYPNVILSDEGIWNNRSDKPGMWRDLKEEARAGGFDVRIIAYIRRQDQLLTSYWSQRIKFPPDVREGAKWEDTLPQADALIRLNYYEVLEEAAAQFGRERITVRVYDPKRFPEGNILFDFLGILGVPMDRDFKMGGVRNSSIYGNALEIVRVLNTMPELPEEALRMATKIARKCCAAEGEAGHPDMFTAEECREFLQRYADSNRLVARDYFGDENLQLFPEPREGRPIWRPDDPGMYETIIRFFAMAVFAPPRDRLLRRMRRAVRKARIAAQRAQRRIAARLKAK